MNAPSKSELRKKYLLARASLDPAAQSLKSQQICQHLEAWLRQSQQPIQQVFLFFSFRNEPDLSWLWQSRRLGKTLGFPVVQAGGAMEFYEWQPGTALGLNRYGIQEPLPASAALLKADAQTLILVPALAMDRLGRRLGYGGAYYDRYLAKIAGGLAIGVLWQQGLLGEGALPHGPYDRLLPWICTEEGIFPRKEGAFV